MTVFHFRRLGGACVLLLLLAATASAQMTAPLGERRLLPQSAASRWLGDISACGGSPCAQTASGEALLPIVGGLKFVMGAGAGRVLDSDAAWTTERRVDARYSTSAVSAWAGVVRTDGRSSDAESAVRTRLESGFRFATSNAEVALSISGGRRTYLTDATAVPDRSRSGDSARTRVDTVPGVRTTELVSLAELRASWSVGRFLLSTVAGRGAGFRSSAAFWGNVEAATPLPRGPLAFLNAGFAGAPGTVGFIGVPRRSLSVGLRFSSATFASRAADRSGGNAAATFAVQRETAGQYRLRVKLPGARFIELASDCTGWKPVTMSRAGNEWDIVLPVSAGSHLVNIRVDGGQWIAPPGLVAKNDDFAGAVGVFVVD